MDQPQRLIGVGVGPGDPELVTVKAVRLLAEADVVLVPRTERAAETEADDRAAGTEAADRAAGTGGRADRIVATACPAAADRIVAVPFSMRERSGVGPARRAAWAASTDAAVRAFRDGARTVCFATVGDPSVYSTFSYLAAEVAREVPDVRIEVVPGITAMQALAGVSRTPLVEGREVLALVPVTGGVEVLSEALRTADTVVAYKAGRRLPEVLDAIAAVRPEHDVLVGTDVGLPDQQLVDGRDPAARAAAPYFSTVLVTPPRPTTGGRL
ncbi:precorrin-2 C(20)-methyltransferase [Raineyella sp. LH-20]|uniref:precorrin-2 C(20)-methyltransferase n=1 Tax=Raineyella sp. LH-20 TaxID=3081204 RepID=UPI002952A020|nr:precorrin-2 C(20)-methyltransferase [Raineyella sp. LH-20]WOP19153.1 precorrin-2 C(20)-methyltransferase [Raineyella sp. LH-20]